MQTVAAQFDQRLRCVLTPSLVYCTEFAHKPRISYAVTQDTEGSKCNRLRQCDTFTSMKRALDKSMYVRVNVLFLHLPYKALQPNGSFHSVSPNRYKAILIGISQTGFLMINHKDMVRILICKDTVKLLYTDTRYNDEILIMIIS